MKFLLLSLANVPCNGSLQLALSSTVRFSVKVSVTFAVNIKCSVTCSITVKVSVTVGRNRRL